MCQKSGVTGILLAIAIAVGILLGVIFPSGFLVFVLCVMLIAVGVMLLIC